jgi:MFS family permease
MITPDGKRLIATRGMRGYADGLIAASLAGHLGDELGYSGTRIGLIVTGMPLGSAVLTMFTGAWGSRFERCPANDHRRFIQDRLRPAAPTNGPGSEQFRHGEAPTAPLDQLVSDVSIGGRRSGAGQVRTDR